ncbi:MAG: uracil phosphoribosyltransferase [Anaerolineales bacterium]|jgi:uracil phosphoribosyltransferase|nr:uracil phosphoribosyltransferase [Anaerolineales bacterium]|tara:strand:- start:4039 stop:4746 length:708 start_codon:yes stop_codon:yes gene_type:complete
MAVCRTRSPFATQQHSVYNPHENELEPTMSNVFPSRHPLVAHKLSRLRATGTPPVEFRKLTGELSSLLAYEATANLKTDSIDVTTPMGAATGATLNANIALAPVLRAGIGMVAGIHTLTPDAAVWHIGLKRDEHTLEPIEYYVNRPTDAAERTCLLLDPMLATGGSASAACSLLKSWGAEIIKYIGLIAAPEGVSRLQQDHPNVPIHVAGVDSHLNDIGFIVPGLGDAGDRQFST